MTISIIPVSLGFVKTFIVKGDKTILVDAGLKGSSKRILRAMRENGITPGDVSLLLVTHAHGDHTGGLKELHKATGAPVAVHALEAGYVEAGESAPVSVRSRAMKLLSVFFRGQMIDGVKTDVRIDGRLDLSPWGVDGYVLPTPGHTAGSVTLVIAGGDAVAGDTIGGGLKPSIPGVYDDLDLLKSSIGIMKNHNIHTVHTSHGGVYRIDDVLTLAQ